MNGTSVSIYQTSSNFKKFIETLQFYVRTYSYVKSEYGLEINIVHKNDWNFNRFYMKLDKQHLFSIIETKEYSYTRDGNNSYSLKIGDHKLDFNKKNVKSFVSSYDTIFEMVIQPLLKQRLDYLDFENQFAKKIVDMNNITKSKSFKYRVFAKKNI